MRLPRGITGYRTLSHHTDIPSVEPADFKATCFAVARLLSGSITSFETSGFTANFHTAVLEFGSDCAAIHCNESQPLIAYSEPNDRALCKLRFRDLPEVTSAFQKIGAYEILTTEELNRPITNDDLANLDLAEIKQIKYWRPRSIGDVVFNCWD